MIRLFPEAENMINELISKKELIIENTLFTKQEQDFLNYSLNSKYGNGSEIRNKYAHGTNSLNEEIQYNDYINLLKIMIIIIVKINDDFCLRDNTNTEIEFV